jgi:hypothetical membrane protein
MAYYHHKNDIVYLLQFGIIAPVVFWLTTFICGSMIEGYNHLVWLVSELGVLGSKTQYIFSAGLLLSAVFNIFYIIGLWKFCKERNLNILPVLFLSMYSFIAGPALFPMPHPLHNIAGIPFVLIILSPMIAPIVWHNKKELSKINSIVIASLFFICLGFLTQFPNILHEYIGMKQRFLYIGWTIWSAGLSYACIKSIKSKK